MMIREIELVVAPHGNWILMRWVRLTYKDITLTLKLLSEMNSELSNESENHTGE